MAKLVSSWFVALALVVALGGLAPTARAQGAGADAGPSVAERIERGRGAMESLDYDVAADELMIAVGDERATLEERIEANLLAGIANRVLGRDVDARLNFLFVLKNRPETRLPEGTTPQIRTFFELIRQELAPAAVVPAKQSLPAGETPPSAPGAPAEPSPQTPSPQTPEPTVEAGSGGSFGWPVFAGAVVLGLAALGGLAAAGVVGLGELYLLDAGGDGTLRGVFITASWVALGLLPVTLLAAAGGAGLTAWGLLE